MKNKGFTLIELLAVLVILSIIALISIPIVLRIVDDSERSSWIISGENYVKAVEKVIMTKKINDPTFKNPYVCEVKTDGNLFCISGDFTLDIDIKGEKPRDGFIEFEDGNITNVNLVYEDRKLLTSSDGDLFISEYELGQEIIYNPGEGLRIWNVIGEDKDTVKLMLNKNIFDDSQYSTGLAYGPSIIMESLNRWSENYLYNVEPIKNYTYINNENGKAHEKGYQKIEIKDGITKIIGKSGFVNELDGLARARLITYEEIVEIARQIPNLKESVLRQYLYDYFESQNQPVSNIESFFEETYSIYDYSYLQNITALLQKAVDGSVTAIFPEWMYLQEDSNILGYWTLTGHSDIVSSHEDRVYIIDNDGLLSSSSKFFTIGHNIGIRPVIVVSKDKINIQKDY